MPTDPDPAERIRAALAGANLSDEQREALVADALAAIAELHAGESSGYYAPAPQPRERARRLREVATAARAAAQAERCFAAAAAELWPPDNLTGWGLWSALHGDAPATGLLRDAEDTTARAGALDRIAAAADAQAERWRAQPPVRGRRREEAARWLIGGLALAWAARLLPRPSARGSASYAEPSAYEAFALAACAVAGHPVSVAVVRAELADLRTEYGDTL